MMQVSKTNTLRLTDFTGASSVSPFQKYMEKFTKSKKQRDEEQDEEENEHPDNGNQNGLQKKIKKVKRQYVKAFQKSMEQKSIELCKRKQLRQCSIQLPRPIAQLFTFLFSGFVPLEILTEINEQQIQTIPIKCEAVEKQKHFFSSNQFSYQINKEFDLAIYLLESKQDASDYSLAQMLKQYQCLVMKQTTFLNQIQDQLLPNEKQIQDFLKQREQYREECLSKYIAEHMSENDFYFCFDVDIHHGDSYTSPSIFKISKSLFALFGISEDEVSNFIVKRNGIDEMFLQYSRRIISLSSLTLKLDNERNASFFQREFQFNTIDGISLLCDILACKCSIEYPPNLRFPSYNSLPFGLEHFIIFKLFISNKQVEQVYTQRQQNSTQQAPKICEDFEYSMVSSIFIEKYYPKEYQSQSRDYSKQDKNAFTNEELSKICKYKSVSPVLSFTEGTIPN